MMSADNWSDCPKCKARELEKVGALKTKIKTSYGKILMKKSEALCKLDKFIKTLDLKKDKPCLIAAKILNFTIVWLIV